MPLPPLSPQERRLGQFALACAFLYAGAGLFFAAMPRWTLKLAAAGDRLTFQPGARLWHILAISMMAMLALCCWLASRAPRENRAFLLPVMLSKAVSTGVALAMLAAWHPVSPEALAGRRTLLTIAGTDFPLLVLTFWIWRSAAPGVHLAAQPVPLPPEPQKPVALGIPKAN